MHLLSSCFFHYLLSPSPFYLYLIVAREVAFPDVLKLRIGELTTKPLQVICEDNTVEVVELMLHNTSQVTRHTVVMLLEWLVLIGDANTRGTLHFLVNAWEAEATFFHHVLL
jgi:hypothetical protein